MTTYQLPTSLTSGNHDLKDIPADLKKYYQFVVWKYETREGKQTKVPYQVNGVRADSTDAETWTDYDNALTAYQTGRFDGIGFVVTPTDKICGIDLDHCRNPETGEIEPEKLEYIKLLNSYTEITPSKSGVRVWIKAKLPEGSRKRNDNLHVEIYDQSRFFTITGEHLEGTPTTIEKRQDELDKLYSLVFPPEVKTERGNGHKQPVSLADTELINKAMSAKNGGSFSRLWNGDTSEHDNDDSRADLALCCMLAFWTGNDESRIDSLFRQSNLFREKWERKDYRERTIKMAISGNSDVYKGNTYMYNTFATNLPTHERNKNATENATSEANLNSKTQQPLEPLSKRIEDWVKTTSAWFDTPELDRDLGIISTADKNNRREIMLRLEDKKTIERHPKINKQFRYVNTKVVSLNFKTATDTGALAFRWPFQLESLVNIYPGNMAVIAGATNAGKTGLILNTIYLNQDKFPIYYFCSEMGDVELRSRLDEFPGMDINDWKFDAIERSKDFADVIRPDCVNIIDYLEMTEELYLVNTHLTAISHKLGSGIAIVALQKKENIKWGRGAEFSAEKTKIYLSLDKGKLTIAKGKSWANKRIDPQGLSIKFSINGGCQFKPESGWYKEDGTEVFRPKADLPIPQTRSILPDDLPEGADF